MSYCLTHKEGNLNEHDRKFLAVYDWAMENLENSLLNAEEELTMHYKNKVIEEAVKDIIRGVRDYVLARMESDRNMMVTSWLYEYED